MATKKGFLKTCFVIAPIGDQGSEIRRRSDQILAYIIKPVAEECGYEAIRADEISEPGIITSQVIQHLIDDDLVIADLTGKNPNVFYELAVRHAVKKPVVQIIQSGESIPFDVAATRTIQVNHQDLESVAYCKNELSKQICSAEKDPSKVDSPISAAIDLKSLHQSKNPLGKSATEIISMLQDLRMYYREMDAKIDSLRPLNLHPFILNIVEEILTTFDDIAGNLYLPEDKEPTRDQVERARNLLNGFLSRLELFVKTSNFPLSSNLADRLDRLKFRTIKRYPRKYN